MVGIIGKSEFSVLEDECKFCFLADLLCLFFFCHERGTGPEKCHQKIHRDEYKIHNSLVFKHVNCCAGNIDLCCLWASSKRL